MNNDFKNDFFKNLRNILNKNGFKRLSSSKYYLINTEIQCMFEIQKSRYSEMYYFNVYYQVSNSNIDPKKISWGVLGQRLESLFPEHQFIIEGISFDTNKNEQEYAEFLLLLDSQFLPQIKKLTESTKLLKDLNIID